MYKPHNKIFSGQHNEDHTFGEQQFKMSQQDQKWKEKKNQIEQRQQQNIKQYSTKKRSKSQLAYEPIIQDFMDRDIFQQQMSTSQLPKKRIEPSQQNDNSLNIFASTSSQQAANLNANVLFWNKPKRITSPLCNRSSSVMLESFCQDDEIVNHQRSQHNQSIQINPNYINRYMNTNVLLGLNDSQTQEENKGCDTNMLHLMSKTSMSGFNHNVSYSVNDRSRENSQTNSRIFNVGNDNNFIQKTCIKTFHQTSQKSKKVLPNPLTGENMKKDKAIGIKIVDSPSKKQQISFDYSQMSINEYSPEKINGIRCKYNNNKSIQNPILLFDVQEPNQNQKRLNSTYSGKKVFRQSPSPVKYLIQQSHVTSQKYQQNNQLNTNKPNDPSYNASPNKQITTAEQINNQSTQNYDYEFRRPKKLVDEIPKVNIPSKTNFLVYQNSSFYQDKFQDKKQKNSKINFELRNRSPNMKEIMSYESSQNNSLLISTTKHNTSINNNNMHNNNVNKSDHKNSYEVNSSCNNSTYLKQQQFNKNIIEQAINQRKSQYKQQENINSATIRRQSQLSPHSLSQQQQLTQQTPNKKQQQSHQNSVIEIQNATPSKSYPNKSQLTQLNSSVLNLSQVKQATKMGEISGVKKIYDFESYKNKYR